MAKRILQPLAEVARDLQVRLDDAFDAFDATSAQLTDRKRHSSNIRMRAAKLAAAIDRGEVEKTLGALCDLIYDCNAPAVSWRVDLTPH